MILRFPDRMGVLVAPHKPITSRQLVMFPAIAIKPKIQVPPRRKRVWWDKVLEEMAEREAFYKRLEAKRKSK